jgi:hypothetical protein
MQEWHYIKCFVSLCVLTTYLRISNVGMCTSWGLSSSLVQLVKIEHDFMTRFREVLLPKPGQVQVSRARPSRRLCVRDAQRQGMMVYRSGTYLLTGRSVATTGVLSDSLIISSGRVTILLMVNTLV